MKRPVAVSARPQFTTAAAFAFWGYLTLVAALGGILWQNRHPLAGYLEVDPTTSHAPIYLGMGCLALGLFVGALLAIELGWWRSSSSWRTAPGWMTSAPADEESPADFKYGFEVNGKSYTGRRIAFGGFRPWEYKAIIRKYRIGTAVEVFYDPLNPHRCCLDRQFKNLWIGCAAALMFSVLGETLAILTFI